jgi:hypothetical protein
MPPFWGHNMGGRVVPEPSKSFWRLAVANSQSTTRSEEFTALVTLCADDTFIIFIFSKKFIRSDWWFEFQFMKHAKHETRDFTSQLILLHLCRLFVSLRVRIRLQGARPPPLWMAIRCIMWQNQTYSPQILMVNTC